MERREMVERGVLASLLLVPSAFKELPEGFDEKAFELQEYQTLFKIIDNEKLQSKGDLAIESIKARYPEMKTVLLNVLFAAVPLNGRFRSSASQLMSHRPTLQQHSEADEVRPNINRPRTRESFSFKVLSGKDIVSMDIPKQKFLIDGLITSESINFLAGEEGCGKSLLAMNLAISIAIGAPQWLCFNIPNGYKVIYLNNELSYNDFGRRFQQMCGSLPTRGDMSNFFAPENVPPLVECWDSLNSLCADIHPGLLVLDCLYFSHSSKENDSSDMKELMRQFVDLRDTFHMAILIVHHTKKGVRFEQMHNDQMRGSGVFGGIADTVLQIRRSDDDETKRLLKPTKFRHVSDEKRKCRLLSLNSTNLWFKDEGETMEGNHLPSIPTSNAKERLDFNSIFAGNQTMTFGEIVEASRPLGYSQRTIQRCIDEALKGGIIQKQGHGVYRYAQLGIQQIPDTG
jgi:hypothetical protein